MQVVLMVVLAAERLDVDGEDSGRGGWQQERRPIRFQG
ncbi:leucine-rich repeat extensin-like protein 3 [Iris pallida]|uniref:Leucine-rich repeat extensin-like protein 3 n=1 Tax=Iris pallida TaxID=29817 RepID=A0AAX6H883_IRIPA|nr:leucine-rich repeat extensin-like protein 3 [Iris pallida]